MSRKHIFIIEDEADIAEIIRFNLVKEGFSADVFGDGAAAVKAVHRKHPDLILLDLMLPGMHGLEVCRTLKNGPSTASIPIIMVSAKGEETDIVTGLELGADDYVTKPFSTKILIARIRLILRRKQDPLAARDEVIKIDDIVINPGRHEVLLKGKSVDMTLSEMKILHLLASRAGWVLTREQIVDAVRGQGYAVTDRAVDVQIVGIRKKLGAKADSIETIRGIGYRFKEHA